MPDVETHLSIEVVHDRLHQANRRGRLPEVHWDAADTFRIALPSRPVVTDLVGRIKPGEAGAAGRIRFALEVRRRTVWWMVAFNLALAVIGPWSTELFIEMYSWWWQPPLCVLGALWVWWRWPGKSEADALSVAPKWIEQIRSRVKSEPVLTAASA